MQQAEHDTKKVGSRSKRLELAVKLAWAIFLTLLLLFFAIPLGWLILTQMTYNMVQVNADPGESLITQEQYNQSALALQAVRIFIFATIALLCVLIWVSIFVLAKRRKN